MDSIFNIETLTQNINNRKRNIIAFFYDVPLELARGNFVVSDSELIISKCSDNKYKLFYNFYNGHGEWYTTRTMDLDNSLLISDLLSLIECAAKYNIPVKCDLNWYKGTGKNFIQSKNIFEMEESRQMSRLFISSIKE